MDILKFKRDQYGARKQQQQQVGSQRNLMPIYIYIIRLFTLGALNGREIYDKTGNFTFSRHLIISTIMWIAHVKLIKLVLITVYYFQSQCNIPCFIRTLL